MRTTITIDDDIFVELMQLTGASSRADAVRQALLDWVRKQRIEKLRSLRGKMRLDGDLEELRKLEIEEVEGLDV